MKAVTDFDRFKATLPYASEIFGVYQPMLGWKSKQKLARATRGLNAISIAGLLDSYAPDLDLTFPRTTSDEYPQLGHILPGRLRTGSPVPQNDSLLLEAIAKDLEQRERPASSDEWAEVLLDRSFEERLNEDVFPAWRSRTHSERIHAITSFQQTPDETTQQAELRLERTMAQVEAEARQYLERESMVARALLDMLEAPNTSVLDRIFYGDNGQQSTDIVSPDQVMDLVKTVDEAYEDPFLMFRPQQDLQDVSLSPVGIVHLFRQYFFEFDTFLGTPISHVWISPDSTVELMEISTRKTTTERSFETTYESIVKSERSTTDEDEISEAVRQENRNDTKVGISSTVQQSWGSGSATATASLNLDKTQQTAREETHRRMRQQTEKLSTEIRQNYKSTFRVVTESTDVTSKRYTLSNNTGKLLNYELRRKMRQVGVQVQDIGTYLCWETFVDEPGAQLGLANLVHIAKPADLDPQPNQKEVDYPPRVVKPFEVEAVWHFGDKRMWNDPVKQYIPLGTFPLSVEPDAGYQLETPDAGVALLVKSFGGSDFEGPPFQIAGRFVGSTQIEVGVVAGPGGLSWDRNVNFVLVGQAPFVPTDAAKKDIDAGNDEIRKAGKAATREEARLTTEAFYTAAKERIDLASDIKPRKFEELREEERTIVYRNLIQTLMTGQLYTMGDEDENPELRHVLSELINSIFDVDKMLYFVAPEWWKPRKHYSQYLGRRQYKSIGKLKPTAPATHGAVGNEAIVNWSDSEWRTDNYYITDKSLPARLGSSLGWLLQLDGDNHRNAFLNAPWVKAVIPIRPGKEAAAMNWLQQVNVEGASGLDNLYSAPAAELDQIKDGLLEEDPNDPVADHPTLRDAIRFLCLQVARKHAESMDVKKFPGAVEIHDDNKVSATPIDKVYEHGFYPLQGGFRVNPANPDPGNPDRNFQIFDQWVEVLPTDQVVPVEVKYNPITGRQVEE